MENITSILKTNKELQEMPLPKGITVGYGTLSIDAGHAEIARELRKRALKMGFDIDESKYTICQRWTSMMIDDSKEMRAFINLNMNEDGTFASASEVKKRIQKAAQKEDAKMKEIPLVTLSQSTKDGNSYKFIVHVRPDQDGSEIINSFSKSGLRCGRAYFKPGRMAYIEVYDTPEARAYLNKNFKKEYKECIGEDIQSGPQTMVILPNRRPIAKKEAKIPVSKIEFFHQ